MSKLSDAGLDDQQRAHETSEVTITLRLPPIIADQVKEVHAADPTFLERVVFSAITRRGIYRGIRDRAAEHAKEHGLRDAGPSLLDSEEAAQRRATRRHSTEGA